MRFLYFSVKQYFKERNISYFLRDLEFELRLLLLRADDNKKSVKHNTAMQNS